VGLWFGDRPFDIAFACKHMLARIFLARVLQNHDYMVGGGGDCRRQSSFPVAVSDVPVSQPKEESPRVSADLQGNLQYQLGWGTRPGGDPRWRAPALNYTMDFFAPPPATGGCGGAANCSCIAFVLLDTCPFIE